ncbi:unnamed protein product [Closterium sp. NIES-54]
MAYISPATAALGRLLLPHLFLELSAFATVEDLVSHLRTSDACYHATVPIEDHFLSLDPTSLTVDLLEEHLLAPETSAIAVGVARSTPRTPFFEGCSLSPLAPSYTSAAAADIPGAEDVGAASPSARRRSRKGKGGRGGGGGSGGGGGGNSGGGGGSGGGGNGGSGGGSGGSGGGGGGNGGSGSSGSGGCLPPHPGIAAAALGASESALPGTAHVEALHTFTLDSGASRCFFRNSTTLTPRSAPVPVRLADPSGGPVIARSSTVLPCLAVSSGSLSGLHLPSFSTNLVSTAALQDAMVTTTTPGGQRVSICTSARTGRHLATFTRRPGSTLYTVAIESPQVVASAQVSASGQVAPPCSSRLLLHQTLLWHHRLGHPSLPRLRGMHSSLLVFGPPRSLPPLPPSPAPPCLPCVEGRQRATPHSSSFPSTTAPLQTLHMDVWGPARVSGQGRERYFLLVVDDYTRNTTVFPLRSKGQVVDVLIPWIRAVCLKLCERFHTDLPVLCLHSGRGGEISSNLLRDFCCGEGILPSFKLPASPQQNGIAERHIDLVMQVALISMFHAAAPHFLWPFAVGYAAHQLNLWPRVSLPETSPTLRWTGQIGDASVFRVWGSRAFVRNTSADKLSTRAIPCGPVPSGVSQVDTLPGTVPVEVAGDSGAARGTASGGAESGGAEPGGAESEGAGSEGAEPGGAEPGGVEPGVADSEGAESRVACSVRSGAAGAGDTGAGGAGVTSRAGGTGGTAAAGRGGARTRGTGASGTCGVGAGGTSARDAGAGGTGAGGAGAGDGGTGAGGAGAEGAGAVDPGAGGAGGTSAGGTVWPRPYFVPLLQQVLGLPASTSPTPPLLCPPPNQSQPPLQRASPLPAPSPYTKQSGGLTERREPASHPVLPICIDHRVPRSRLPPVPGTHAMELCPSSVPLRVPLPPPPESSLPAVSDPKSDLARATSSTVSRLLAGVVTGPSFGSTIASALTAELLDFAAACRLDYALALFAVSKSASPPSVGGECALRTDVLEDRQEDIEYLAAAVPRFASMLLAPEGDPDPPDIPTPRSYAQAIMGPYSSQWRAAMDAEMASWKSTSTYDNAAPPSRANIVDGMWIFMVKRPPGSRPAFKARYIARGFTPPLDESVEPSGPYQELVGFLMYLMTCTRLDLAYPLSLLARYVAPGRLRKVHWDAAKRLLRYLCDTSGMGLVLGGRGPVVLTVHADASWVDDLATQRSS